MTSPDWSSLLELYQRTVCSGVLEYLEKQTERKTRRSVYSAAVVLWLMILQRLQGRATLASAVQLMLAGAAGPVAADCRRVREGRISSRTAGYCQARQRLPTVLFQQVSEEMVERLRSLLQPEGGPATFVLDGSSLELEHSQTLAKQYPPARNHHGISHWPMVRIVVAHDVETALAQQPCWGPMYGPHATSEQKLAESVLDSLPAGSLVIGDRNFGVFSVAWAAQQRSLPVLVRLTEARAKKILGFISRPGVYDLLWKASRWDHKHHPDLPAEATLTGRLVAARVGCGKSKQWLYLFTTSPLPAAQLVALYGKRWNIETDLRSLKRTVHLHHIHAHSEEMMEKELRIAISAYNLVRAVMCLAARRSGIDPRQLSFTQVLNVVDYAWHQLVGTGSHQQQDQEFLRVLERAAQCRLPQRPKRRSFPRTQWRRGGMLQFKKPLTE